MILASEQLIKEWTGKGAWIEKTLIDYFKEHVAAQPDKVCLVDPPNKKDLMGLEPERLTYKELDLAVDATAEELLKIGIKETMGSGLIIDICCKLRGGGLAFQLSETERIFSSSRQIL